MGGCPQVGLGLGSAHCWVYVGCVPDLQWGCSAENTLPDGNPAWVSSKYRGACMPALATGAVLSARSRVHVTEWQPAMLPALMAPQTTGSLSLSIPEVELPHVPCL